MKNQIIDHLFRYHSGKMVSVLTRIFGLQHLETIEDAVQDTFIQASLSWRHKIPENPEAWLIKAAKNRTLDIFRKLKSEEERNFKFTSGLSGITLNDLFLEHEIEDSQLRMIFTACHPILDSRDRIAFALKTVSGFSIREIASALLTKEETIKKRLARSRKEIVAKNISFTIPQGIELSKRLHTVMEVIYLIFNEGFHSVKKDEIIRKELCGEALRLCKMVLQKESIRTSETYALFALLCFHASRLEAKTNGSNELLNLKEQDRTLWYKPLIETGNIAMDKALSLSQELSFYHIEAAIASEHLKAKTFEETNWAKILFWYQCLEKLDPSPSTFLNMAVVCLQLQQIEEAKKFLEKFSPSHLGPRGYLYHGTMADYYLCKSDVVSAKKELKKAIELAPNASEKKYLLKKTEVL
ncbi:MAG: sigma-70 family RNA polymerase sigma factor [Flavobacteriaceae bacterium]|nr:sigma-70 family RNA polymerase sigma factor [Flavobacteriaceae bacterium]